MRHESGRRAARPDEGRNPGEELRRRDRRPDRSKPRSSAGGGRRAARRRSSRSGVIFVCICLFLFAALLVYQLYQIQIVSADVNAKLAADQHYKRVPESPRRGRIVDRNGVELAGTTYVYRIGITPKDVRSISKTISSAEIAASLADILKLDLASVTANLAATDESYIQLKKDVAREEADALKAYISKADLGGIRIDTEPRRYYTNGTLASQVIGFTNFDDGQLIGQLGIELQYDTRLTGQPGYTYVETDNYGSKGTLPFSVPTSLRATDGQNIMLNIDINIQKIAQEELANAITTYDITAGGTVIVMNPYTGAILAMASYPFFNSSVPAARPEWMEEAAWNADQDAAIDYLTGQIWRNRAISDTYEPGSTMKALTASIALEEGLTQESESMSDAPLHLYNWVIRCSTGNGHGTETMEMGFWRSCNPIFAQLALRTGVDRYYSYIRSFGLMSMTGIDLPGEGAGILHQAPTDLDMATLSFGESSTVTPIQLAAAYCVFANGGNLVRPTVVKAITNSDGEITSEIRPETIRKVLSETTSARIRELLKGVVLYGTGSASYVEGYAIAGKTSTSTDDNGDHYISFASLAPADNPEIVSLVVLNKPTDKKLTSKAAAKTNGLIVARTLEYLGVTREYNESDVSRLNETVDVPDVVGMTYADALKELSGKSLGIEAGDKAMGDETLVKYQWPASGTKLHKKGLVVLYPVEDPEEQLMIIPDFTGRTINECQTMAAESGLNIRISGNTLGVAVSQDPLPTFGESGLPNNPTSPTGPTDPTSPTDPADPGQTAGTGTTEPAAGEGEAANPTDTPQPGGQTTEATSPGDPGNTNGTEATQGSQGTGGTDNTAARLVRGSIVTITFVAVEEEFAESGDTETTPTTVQGG